MFSFDFVSLQVIVSDTYITEFFHSISKSEFKHFLVIILDFKIKLSYKIVFPEMKQLYSNNIIIVRSDFIGNLVMQTYNSS